MAAIGKKQQAVIEKVRAIRTLADSMRRDAGYAGHQQEAARWLQVRDICDTILELLEIPLGMPSKRFQTQK